VIVVFAAVYAYKIIYIAYPQQASCKMIKFAA
jgi:hypothetical protein